MTKRKKTEIEKPETEETVTESVTESVTENVTESVTTPDIISQESADTEEQKTEPEIVEKPKKKSKREREKEFLASKMLSNQAGPDGEQMGFSSQAYKGLFVDTEKNDKEKRADIEVEDMAGEIKRPEPTALKIKMGEGKRRVTTFLPDDSYDFIKRVAKKHQISKAQVARKLLLWAIGQISIADMHK